MMIGKHEAWYFSSIFVEQKFQLFLWSYTKYNISMWLILNVKLPHRERSSSVRQVMVAKQRVSINSHHVVRNIELYIQSNLSYVTFQMIIEIEGKLILRSHNTSYCLIEVAASAGLTVYPYSFIVDDIWVDSMLILQVYFVLSFGGMVNG